MVHMPKRFIAFLLLLTSGVAVYGQDLSHRINEIMTQPGREWFMGSILMARDGRMLFEKSYGFANLKETVPISAQTRFRIGSLTKQFTAAAVLLLEDRGKLKTAELLKHYLPDAPAAWEKITVYHLLTHTSGIPDYVDSGFESIKAKAITPEQLIKIFRNRPLEFSPGMKESYSSSNYILLGYLIERITGQTYGEFLRANIFGPLGMNDSGVDNGETNVPQEATGYYVDNGSLTIADYVNMTSAYSAGSIYSTPQDLLRWEQGLFGGKLLSNAALKKMTTPFLSGYACGLHVEEPGGRKIIYHSGRIDGFSGYLAYYPDDKLVIVALSNVWNREMAKIVSELAAQTR